MKTYFQIKESYEEGRKSYEKYHISVDKFPEMTSSDYDKHHDTIKKHHGENSTVMKHINWHLNKLKHAKTPEEHNTHHGFLSKIHDSVYEKEHNNLNDSEQPEHIKSHIKLANHHSRELQIHAYDSDHQKAKQLGAKILEQYYNNYEHDNPKPIKDSVADHHYETLRKHYGDDLKIKELEYHHNKAKNAKTPEEASFHHCEAGTKHRDYSDTNIQSHGDLITIHNKNPQRHNIPSHILAHKSLERYHTNKLRTIEKQIEDQRNKETKTK